MTLNTNTNANTNTGKNEEKEKEFHTKNNNVDMSHLKTFLHFDDFLFYSSKIVLSEIWIFRLTNLTEKSKTKKVTENILNEEEREDVVDTERVGNHKERIYNGSEISKEEERKSQAENDKKTKNNFSDGRKKNVSDKKKENKDKDNLIENDSRNENGDHEEKDIAEVKNHIVVKMNMYLL